MDRHAHRGDEGVARVIVEDRGPGIPAGKRRACSSRFERLRSAILNEGVSGTGIGLTISRELAQLHGGKLVGLPAVSRRRAFHPHPAPSNIAIMTKILIAEDDEHTRDALREVLTMEGFTRSSPPATACRPWISSALKARLRLSRCHDARPQRLRGLQANPQA
jgi:hypothetical protein